MCDESAFRQKSNHLVDIRFLVLLCVDGDNSTVEDLMVFLLMTIASRFKCGK